MWFVPIAISMVLGMVAEHYQLQAAYIWFIGSIGGMITGVMMERKRK